MLEVFTMANNENQPNQDIMKELKALVNDLKDNQKVHDYFQFIKENIVGELEEELTRGVHDEEIFYMTVGCEIVNMLKDIDEGNGYFYTKDYLAKEAEAFTGTEEPPFSREELREMNEEPMYEVEIFDYDLDEDGSFDAETIERQIEQGIIQPSSVYLLTEAEAEEFEKTGQLPQTNSTIRQEVQYSDVSDLIQSKRWTDYIN